MPRARHQDRRVSASTRATARRIEIVSWLFVAFGLLLPLAFHTWAFAAYRDTLLAWAYGAPPLPAADEKLERLMLGILGGSIAGKWIVHAMIARGPLAEGRPWARDLTLRGLAAWFFVDSIASLALGATFNVWMINLVPVALVGVPLFLSYAAFDETHDDLEAARNRRRPYVRACLFASLFGAATGLAIAFGGNTAFFTMWWSGLSASHYGGATIAEPAHRFALFFFGPIGGCTFAQFLMLAGLVAHEGGTPRVAAAGATSIAVWFVADSAWGLTSGGLFNVLLVNVPAIAATLPPWILLAKSLATSRRQRAMRPD
jgi:hypothetical protein